MKNLVYCFTFFLFVNVQGAFAQTREIGLRATSAFTQVQFNPEIDQAQQRNIYGGLALRFLNEKNAGVQVELNYGRRSYRSLIDSLTYEGRSYEVIELPLMTHLRFGKGKFSSYIHLGSLIDYVIAAEEERLANGQLTNEVYSLNPSIDNRWNYALAGGFGLSYDLGPGKVQAEGRYAYYFGSIEKSLLVTRFSQPRSLQVSLSYFVKMPRLELFRKKEISPEEKDEPIQNQDNSVKNY
jgi:hypothetical protein